MRRSCRERGFKAGLLPAVTATGNFYGDARFDPIYAAAQELGIPLAVHGGTSQRMGLEGVGRMATVHALEHPFAILLQLTHMIFEGVFERFPSLRVAFLEAGAGWVPYMMDRLDEEWEKPMGKGLPISQSPSALMSSGQIFVSCEVEESSLPEVIRRTGASQILWPSDFPHERPRSAFGGDLPKFHRRTDLSAEVKQAIVWENPKRFYRL